MPNVARTAQAGAGPRAGDPSASDEIGDNSQPPMSAQVMLALCATALLATVTYLALRDWRHPAFMQAGLWMAVLLFQTLSADTLFPLRTATCLLIAAGSFAFFLGAHAAGTPPHAARAGAPLRDTRIALVLLAICVAGLPAYVSRAVDYASRPDDAATFLQAVRVTLITDEAGRGYGILAYLNTVSIAMTTAFFMHWLHRPTRRNTALLAVALAVTTPYLVLSSARTGFLLLLCALTGVVIHARKVALVRGVVLPLGAFLLIFAFINVAQNRSGNADDTLLTRLLATSSAVRHYALAPVTALDVYMHDVSMQPTYGAASLRTPIAVLAQLGVPIETASLFNDQVAVPELVNVFTVFRVYVDDFGMGGAIAVLGLLGLAHGLIFRRGLGGDARAQFFYAVGLYPLAMQIFQDQYASLLSTWVQFALLGWLLFRAPARDAHVLPVAQAQPA